MASTVVDTPVETEDALIEVVDSLRDVSWRQ